MNAQINALLKPEVLNSINGLELIARIIVEGFMSGSNKSQSVGIGQEFSQYRSYEPGDDLRLLDWKMYARSERYFIKLADIETNITVKFILDASNSMSYTEGGVTRLQYGKVLIAALAYLARKQRDAYGLYTINDKDLDILQPRMEQQQFMRFLDKLVRLKSQGLWRSGKNFDALMEHHGKEMIVLVSDLYDRDGDILQFITKLKTSRNEVLVLHLLGQHELYLDEEGSFTFEDLESGERLKVDTMAQRKQYREQVAHWIKGLRNTLLEKQINYHLVRMNDPAGEVLQKFLKSRNNLLPA